MRSPKILSLSGTASISIALILSALVPVSAFGATPNTVDPTVVSKYPRVGDMCSGNSKPLQTTFYLFVCDSNQKWQKEPYSYAPPANYLKGYTIGQSLVKANPETKNGAMLCYWSSDGQIIKSGYKSPGFYQVEKVRVLEDYWGLTGCWDAVSNSGKSSSKTISQDIPLANGIQVLNNGQKVNAWSDITSMWQDIADSFSQGTQSGIDSMHSYQYQEAFDATISSSCDQQRLDANWKLDGYQIVPQSLSYDPSWTATNAQSDNTFADRLPATPLPLTNIPLKMFIFTSYSDNNNSSVVDGGTWFHVVYSSDGQPKFFLSTCTMIDEAANADSTYEFSNAPRAMTPPSGKVDKTSNAYKTMFKVGKNFAKVSMANDSASSQCSSALKTGMIRSNGIPQYLGTQTRMLQSYLQTASGYQGCLDGFGH